jgi:hypothetical protein
MGDYEMEIGVNEARKLVAGKIVGFRLDRTIYRVDEHRDHGIVVFSFFSTASRLGRSKSSQASGALMPVLLLITYFQHASEDR